MVSFRVRDLEIDVLVYRQRQLEKLCLHFLRSGEVVDDAGGCGQTLIDQRIRVPRDLILAIREAEGRAHRTARQFTELTGNPKVGREEFTLEAIDSIRDEPFQQLRVVCKAH